MKAKILLTCGELRMFLQLGDDFMTATCISIDIEQAKKILKDVGEAGFSEDALDYVKKA